MLITLHGHGSSTSLSDFLVSWFDPVFCRKTCLVSVLVLSIARLAVSGAGVASNMLGYATPLHTVPEEGSPIIMSYFFFWWLEVLGVFVNTLGAYEFFLCTGQHDWNLCSHQGSSGMAQRSVLGNSAVETLKVQKGPWVQQRPWEYKGPRKGTYKLPMAWIGYFWQQ